MIQKVFHLENTRLEWVDVVAPTAEEYEELANQYDLHPAAVKDCLSPNHLPKCELIGNTLFMILRIRDDLAPPTADDLGSLTNKVAIFSSEQFIITIHRKEERFLNQLMKEWTDISNVKDPSRDHLFNSFVHEVIYTFEQALIDAELKLDRYEQRIFEKDKKSEEIIQGLYAIKRRASAFKRTLLLTKETLIKFNKYNTAKDPFSTDLIESTETLYFLADEAHETVNNLLNLHISLASHRTNEVMGVLTVFSVFFLPLTFIVGLYGMNFRYMPEVQYKWGYPLVIAVMLFTTAMTYIWFKRKKWL